GLWIDAEDPILAFVQDALTGRRVPIPGSHAAGRERMGATPLAFQQSRRRPLELGGALGNASLQLAIEPLELTRLAVELGKYLDLGPEDFGNDGNRHVVHGPH